MGESAEQVVEFWAQVGPKGWYVESRELDEEIIRKFKGLWQDALAGKLKEWQLSPKGALALIILLDQFPRNMFRGHGDSFASDRMALCVAQKAIHQNFDQEIDGNMRQFFYLPLMHSESIMDQDASVRAFLTRMPGTSNLLHARAHRQVIRDFGRFPYRNAVLERKDTEEEIAYLAAGGYRFTVENMAD
ncbi:MAG: DUF924 family protein [Paracoccaceae bacterium]